MKMEKLGFQAEVSRLLDIVAHSLYSDRAVFLRELISNASDACDKLRYLSLTEPGLVADDPEFKITVALDKDGKTLTVSDNGIGMNREELDLASRHHRALRLGPVRAGAGGRQDRRTSR